MLDNKVLIKHDVHNIFSHAFVYEKFHILFILLALSGIYDTVRNHVNKLKTLYCQLFKCVLNSNDT